MKNRLIKLLGIEPGEESMVALLLLQSVFLGIFFGAFDISAHSFFLSAFDEKMMARGYVLSGLTGIILTSLYTWLQVKIRFRDFAVINLVFVTLLTMVLWILLKTNTAGWVIWLVFIMFGPLNILALLGFWGTTGRLFSLRQGKRLFGLVDAGIIIGIILSCYAVPVLLTLDFKPHNILLISTVAVFTGSMIQVMIGSRFGLRAGSSSGTSEPAKEKRSFLAVFRTDPYIRTMALFITLSVMVAFFVQYSFMAVTRLQYPAEEDMASFLGLFTGSMMIFTLLVKLLVFSYLIKNYGLRTCLALSPVLIAAFTLVAVLIGLIKGYTPAAGIGFMLFFMILALSRLFSKSLKDSIESPSFKVIYQTIDEKIRYEVQSGMDGTVNEIAALSSGLILAGLGMIGFIKLIHFSLVLIVIAALWIYLAIRLYSGYRNSIRRALDEGSGERKASLPEAKADDYRSRFSAMLAFRDDYFSLVSGKPDSLKDKSPGYYKVLISRARSENDLNLVPALKKIAGDTSLEDGIRHEADKTAESLELLSSGSLHKDDKVSSARKLLSDSRVPQTTQMLRLLRDNSLISKTLAIHMIGKFRITDMLAEVCDCLNNPALESQAANVIKSFGDHGYKELRRFYFASTGNINVSRTIINLLACEKSEDNREFLFGRLWSNSRQIREMALEKLLGCGFVPTDEEKDRLHQMISDLVGILFWNLSARITLKKSNNEILLEPLNKEINRWNRFLFNLLSITYDPASIDRIRENLESETVGSVNYALEMADMVIDESVKPKLMPLLDIISDEEKIRQLYQFFPGEIPEYNRLLEDILNRDYNLLGIWIRACVLRNLNTIEPAGFGESVTALLFSPEIILQEESASLLARTGNDLFSDTYTRIPKDTRKRVMGIASGVTASEGFVFEKTRFLESCFSGLDEEDLLPLSGALNFFGKTTAGNLPDGGYILWTGAGNNARIFYEKEDIASENNYILPLASVEEFCNHYPEKAGIILKFIEGIES